MGISIVVEIIMLRHIVGGLVVGLAAIFIGALPAVRPHVDSSKLRLARFLDRTSLAIEGSTENRRLLAAGIEPLADFPESTALRQIGRSVGLLWVDHIDRASKTRTHQCTATLIAPDVLMTNHHCLESEGAAGQLKFEFWIDYRGGSPVRHELDPTPIEIDPQLDVALLRLVPPAAGRKPVPLAHLRFRAALPGERLFLLHHPGSKPMQVTRTRCRVAAPFVVGEQVLRHTCATSPGSSGTLVFAEQDLAIVGLHHSRRKSDDDTPGVATPVSSLLAKSATLRRLAPGGLAQAAAR